MRRNDRDDTLKKNYIQKYQFLISEYEQIKSKEHPTFSKVKDFYVAHGTCPQTFLKYYARYIQSNGSCECLLPQKRGPRYKTRRTPLEIENLVLEQRKKGSNRFEIASILKPNLKEKTPSPSCIYHILKRYGQNRIKTAMREEKRRIIKEKAGELAHIDCHYLSKDTIANDSNRYYLVCVIDSCTRIAWAEVMDNIKSLTVMFKTLACLNQIVDQHDIRFAEALTDNGAEFGARHSAKKDEHPFERMLLELGIKHRYTRPYRPQTNGKVERFWRTLNEDLVDGTHFDSIEHFKEELFQYLLYYNRLRPHQALAGKTPAEFEKTCQRIT